MSLKKIFIEDFNYNLPDEKIALFAVEPRDNSKLLVYDKGIIKDSFFKNISDFLKPDSVLFLNNTKVIHARLIFFKETGAQIEIFCLEPLLPSNQMGDSLMQTSSCTWKCMIGNAKKWKNSVLKTKLNINGENIIINASKEEENGEYYSVKFFWDNKKITFSEILNSFGKIPLPPYINRDTIPSDKIRYQTVYANEQGSVAAPTAGLHFTQSVFNSLKQKNIQTHFITLHVGAGTFKPVSTSIINDHTMHSEVVDVPIEQIKFIAQNKDKHITAVGTTTVRTLESIYWQGVYWLVNNKNTDFEPFLNVSQFMPYELENKNVSVEQSFSKIIEVLEKNNLDKLYGKTSLMIAPGYNYKVVKTIITNFHQPKSTLLLLVSAFIGDDWKRVYNYALENNYRFLSFGDACLFIN